MVCTRLLFRKQSTGVTEAPPESPVLLVLMSELQVSVVRTIHTVVPLLSAVAVHTVVAACPGAKRKISDRASGQHAPMAPKANAACAQEQEKEGADELGPSCLQKA